MAGYIGSKSSVTLVDGYTEAEADAEFVNDPNGAITVDGSNVGIGTSSPEGQLHVYSSSVGAPSADANDLVIEKTGDTGLSILSTTTGRIYFGDAASNDQGSIRYVHSDNSMRFETDSSERLRIDSSGNLLVGTTDSAVWNDTTGTGGINLRPDGVLASARNGGEPLLLNRLGTDGELIKFNKNGTTIASIGVLAGDNLYIQGSSGHAGLESTNLGLNPFEGGSTKDNLYDLGSSSARWDDIYATNGTIQTSDATEKQDIASLTATEMLVGARISTLFKTFRWKDSVAEKGDNARTHTGVIAQDVQAAFTAEGLDAGDYALFISSTWWEHDVDVPAVEAVEAVEAVTETTTDEEGNEVVTVITEAVEAVEAVDAYTRTDTYDTEAEAPEGATSKTRMGIRYPELLSFVAAYNEQRFASIEARLTALEA